MPYLLIAVPALIVLLAVFVYAEWEKFDDCRRRERLVHRNLQRMSGQ